VQLTQQWSAQKPLPSNWKAPPRVGFLGIGWIGSNRLKAIADSGTVAIAAIMDCNAQAAAAAASLVGEPPVLMTWEALLQQDLDALVIATPTALHAEQSIAALDAGLAVLCQKPLALEASQARQVIAAARRANRLLAVDMSYRYLRSVALVKQLIEAGEIGTVFAADLVFHNAYGPDKPWYYTPALAGGGCVIDLGVHLIDLALWILNETHEVRAVSSRLFSDGRALEAGEKVLEDYATARMDLASGTTVNLACSWRLNAGREAVIRATFYGTKGTLEISNVAGSFYDFSAERFTGTARMLLDQPPDNWSGRAAIAWCEALCRNRDYDPAIEYAATVAEIIDRIYGR
jgi:predicted dehydrogenase